MNNVNAMQECQCACGDTQFLLKAKPIVRAFCHCTICQEFSNAAYADVTIFLSKDVRLYDEEKVNFKKYKSPPAVQRGKCAKCNKPAIELLDFPLFPSLTIIPSGNIPMGAFLPDPVCHIFYQRRISDISDSLPKYSGFIQSQIALSTRLLPGLVRRLTNGQ